MKNEEKVIRKVRRKMTKKIEKINSDDVPMYENFYVYYIMYD